MSRRNRARPSPSSRYAPRMRLATTPNSRARPVPGGLVDVRAPHQLQRGQAEAPRSWPACNPGHRCRPPLRPGSRPAAGSGRRDATRKSRARRAGTAGRSATVPDLLPRRPPARGSSPTLRLAPNSARVSAVAVSTPLMPRPNPRHQHDAQSDAQQEHAQVGQGIAGRLRSACISASGIRISGSSTMHRTASRNWTAGTAESAGANQGRSSRPAAGPGRPPARRRRTARSCPRPPRRGARFHCRTAGTGPARPAHAADDQQRRDRLAQAGEDLQGAVLLGAEACACTAAAAPDSPAWTRKLDTA